MPLASRPLRFTITAYLTGLWSSHGFPLSFRQRQAQTFGFNPSAVARAQSSSCQRPEGSRADIARAATTTRSLGCSTGAM